MSSLSAAARPRTRVVLDNDWAGDPDGLLALVHHALAPGNLVEAVTSSFLNPNLIAAEDSSAEGARLARDLLALLGCDAPVHVGAESAYGCIPGLGESTRQSDASEAIAAAARRDDELPLFVVCGGPLTNVAAALEAAPDIIGRFTLVWIGGSISGANFEYNRDTDPMAAEFVLGKGDLALHQFPVETYSTCLVSAGELDVVLASAGVVGQFLAQRYAALPDFVIPSGGWVIGDSPSVLVTAVHNPFAGPATGGRTVHTTVDMRLLMGDLTAHAASIGLRSPRRKGDS